MLTSSSEAAVATLNAGTSSANSRNFFMFGFSPSLEHFCRILGSCRVETIQPEFPDLEPVFARDHTLTALSSQSSSIKKLLGWLGLTGPPPLVHIQFGLKGANYPA